MSLQDKIAAFRRLHEGGCFVIPNPWDFGSARWLRGLGFKALATTSSGAAWSLGSPDNGLSVDQVLAHVRSIVEATELPVNADFEAGYAADAQGVARNVTRCLETGVAALSIEDSTGDKAKPLYELAEAVERMRAARSAIDAKQSGALLVGRAECFLTGHVDPLNEAIRRLQAYAQAGADVLYAPGVRTREQIAAVVKAVAPKPVNVLIGWPSDLTVADIAALGVRRISVGGALARAAWAGFAHAAETLAKDGSFAGFATSGKPVDLNGFFRQDSTHRDAQERAS
jgi:2-methylisocitrate lyase-like PEP mutase family enzyme